MVKEGDVIAVWFSCGAASAVAAKKTIDDLKREVKTELYELINDEYFLWCERD